MYTEFGGRLLFKKRKSKRPLNAKKPTHLVLRLKDRIPSFFNPHDRNLKNLFLTLAEKNEVKVYHLVFNHTHCHCVIKFKHSQNYIRFIRELTSRLVAYFSKQIKVNLKRIFDSRPWTRIIQWGKDFMNITNYMKKNEKESGLLQPLKRNLNHSRPDTFQLSLFQPFRE